MFGQLTGRGTGELDGERCERVVAEIGFEWGQASRGSDVVVEAELGGRQIAMPVIVKGVYVAAHYLLQALVGPLGLPVGLGVVSC